MQVEEVQADARVGGTAFDYKVVTAVVVAVAEEERGSGRSREREAEWAVSEVR